MYMKYMQKGGYNCKSDYMDDSCMETDSLYSDTCSNVANESDYYDDCACGFEENKNVFPENPMFAQSYVPWQTMDKTFKPEIGLKMGTIFPELVDPYSPGQSLEEIEFIRATNKIGEGCNK